MPAVASRLEVERATKESATDAGAERMGEFLLYWKPDTVRAEIDSGRPLDHVARNSFAELDRATTYGS